MDAGAWVGVIAGILTTLLSAAAAAWVVILNARHKVAQETQRDGMAAMQAVVDRLEAQLARHEAAGREQLRALAMVQEAHADCEARLGEFHGWMGRFRDCAVRLAAIARRHGDEPGDIPELPPRREPSLRPEDAEFARRNAAQSGRLLEALDPPRARPQTPPPANP